MDTLEIIKKIVASVLKVNPNVLSPTTAAGELQEWDSVHTIMIIAEIERHFGVHIPEEDLFDLTSIQTLADEIEKLK